MSVDWITVAAQIANFLVLVWLLRRFLYRPILAGIDARERQIAARMAQAEKIREAAEAARRALPEGVRCVLARGLDRSPLHEKVAANS